MNTRPTTPALSRTYSRTRRSLHLLLLPLLCLLVLAGCAKDEKGETSSETTDKTFDFSELPLDATGHAATTESNSPVSVKPDASRGLAKPKAQALTDASVLEESVAVDDIGPDVITTDEILNGTIMTADLADYAVVNQTVSGEAITVVVSRFEDVDAETTGKVVTLTGEDILNSNTNSALGEVARTVSADGALRVRAGRASETSIRRDGVTVGDPVSGGLGPGTHPDVDVAVLSSPVPGLDGTNLESKTDKINCQPPLIEPEVVEPIEPEPIIEEPAIAENAFRSAETSPFSTFSIDVDAASYTNVRAHIERGEVPSPTIVRIEEMINFFTYDYAAPVDRHPFAFATQVAPCPWKPENRLVRVALQGRHIDLAQAPPSNLVFLIDVSGSMSSKAKLGLLKESFGTLIDGLRPEDRVAIVTYAGNAGVVLNSTPGTKKKKIRASLKGLSSGGSTAGAAGIVRAYEIAAENFIEGGNNRVILATDGDFNVGISDTKQLVALIEEKREGGVFLSVLGFGRNFRADHRMEQLADNGNGNYYYIDRIEEGERVFGASLSGTLMTIAKDVKLQLKFNPELVAGYRLIGYENRVLAARDFDDDTKDAGELGSGHSVTALYEVIPAGVESDYAIDTTDTEDYELADAPPTLFTENDLLLARLRYKEPDGTKSQLIEHLILDRITEIERCDDDFRFVAAVASWGMLLRRSGHAGSATPASILTLAKSGLGPDPTGDRAAFVTMVEKWNASNDVAGK